MKFNPRFFSTFSPEMSDPIENLSYVLYSACSLHPLCARVSPLWFNFLSFFPAGREVDGDSRGYRSAEEQARELTRAIRREVNKLSDKWNALIDRSDLWKRKLDESLSVSDPILYF